MSMATPTINKVDMSLDEIIKVNRAEKRQQAKATKLQSMRGAARGATRGGARGRGRGGAVSVSGLRGGLRGVGRKQMKGGRGSLRGGGGRGASNRGNLVSNRGNTKLTRGAQRGRGRGRGQKAGGQGLGQTQVFTNSGLGKVRGQGQRNQRSQQLNLVREQAKLLKQKQAAIRKLEQAKKTMQTVTLALQQSSRDAVVNQKRGLDGAAPISAANGRGRGRGKRKLLAALTRPGANTSNNNINHNNIRPNQAAPRFFNHTSVTITNPTAINPQKSQRGRRRPWRKPRATEPFKIEVSNDNPVPIQQPQTSVLDKLKLLKPAVPTTYKFQKNVFAAPTTGVSLSDRFAAAGSSGGQGQLEERKVFV